MLNNKLNGYMCELFSIGVKNEPAIKFVTDFWDNPRILDILPSSDGEHLSCNRITKENRIVIFHL